MDVVSILASTLASASVPTVVVSFFLIRQQRAKLNAEARQGHAAADETDAKAEVLLAGEALKLFQEARRDAKEAREEAHAARREAAEARREALVGQRSQVEVWAALDANDRHMRRLEAAIADLGGTVPPRPAELVPRLHPE